MQKIAIIGLGMIGGSIAAAVKHFDICKTVVAYDTDLKGLEYAHNRGWIDGYFDTIRETVEGADLIIVGTPVDCCPEIFAELAKHVAENQMITDVCSVKAPVVACAKKALKNRISQFVPGHPIAGSEKSGAAAADEKLFYAQRIVLTPIPEVSQSDAVCVVTCFWKKLGAEVFTLDPEEHDRILAKTSHLPHIIAFAYLVMLSQHADTSEIFRYIGGGFRDCARLGASDLHMWRSIFFSNRNNIVDSIDTLVEQLERLKRALLSGNVQEVENMIQIANRTHEAAVSMRNRDE